MVCRRYTRACLHPLAAKGLPWATNLLTYHNIAYMMVSGVIGAALVAAVLQRSTRLGTRAVSTGLEASGTPAAAPSGLHTEPISLTTRPLSACLHVCAAPVSPDPGGDPRAAVPRVCAAVCGSALPVRRRAGVGARRLPPGWHRPHRRGQRGGSGSGGGGRGGSRGGSGGRRGSSASRSTRRGGRRRRRSSRAGGASGRAAAAARRAGIAASKCNYCTCIARRAVHMQGFAVFGRGGKAPTSATFQGKPKAEEV